MGLIILRCGGERHGVDVQWVREIRPYTGATPLPGLPPFWAGVTALRGRLYPVLDLRQFLFPEQLFTERLQQVAFTAVDDVAIGLLVEEIVSASEAGFSYDSELNPLFLLDLPALLADPRLVEPAEQG
jgi:chemotaxis signal transduction protein